MTAKKTAVKKPVAKATPKHPKMASNSELRRLSVIKGGEVNDDVLSKQDKAILADAVKIKKAIEALHKRAEKLTEGKVGVLVDLLVFNNKTKGALDGCSLGMGCSLGDEMHYIEAVKGSRMLRITDNFVDNLSKDIKKRRGIIK